MLLSITKLQNLKAIHNRLALLTFPCLVVINHKTTKFESNSQQQIKQDIDNISCYQSQNYKIWKQFTTLPVVVTSPLFVVINHKTTKFESNSQPAVLSSRMYHSCYQSQNYKIWKQFTTRNWIWRSIQSCYQSQNYKIWKQFTTHFRLI